MSGASQRRPAPAALAAAAVIVALAVAGFALRKPLAVWFLGEPAPVAPTSTPNGPSNQEAPYPQVALDALRNALDAADRVRALLARDQLARVADEARTLAEALRAAGAALAPRAQIAGHANAAATASERLAAAQTLDDARNAFAELSEQLIALAAADARLQNGLFVYECAMFGHGAKWIQRTPAIDNPYMGARMPACGNAIGWKPDAQAEDADAIDHYTCSMHPSVHASARGACPICGMTLVPVTKAQQREGVVTISPSRQQLIGVRTSPAIKGPMVQSISAVGRFTYDESSLVDVNLKVRGWIVKLLVSKTGQHVQKGQALFTFYSPELQTAQQDLLLALRSQPLLQGAAKSDPGSLGRAARQRLRLLDLTDAQIDSIASAGEPLAHLTFTAPASGFVIEKDVVEGSAVEPGMRLFRIASLNKVWIEADVYEGDFPRLHVGQKATVALDYLPGRSYEATLAYVYPALDPQTRKGRVRLELRNQNLEFKPGMFATVQLQSDLGSRLQVPASAVIYTGPRRLVFVDLGEGRFRPQEVQIGAEANGMYEVLSGLSAGDMVAVSGVFLIAAEARISTAAKYWEGTESGELNPVQNVPAKRPETP